MKFKKPNFLLMSTIVYGRFFAALILLASFYIYYFGRTGGLLLDDVVNMNLLDDLGSFFDLDQLLQFLVLQGKNNTLGRPVSLLSFAMQLNAWRAGDFASFKIVNICIHLLNGVFVWLISMRVGRQLDVGETATAVCSLLFLAFWVLHPINVSTVLYVVQRMAQLSSLFMLLSVWAYLKFRQDFSNDASVARYAVFSILLVSIGVLALLSKENGALIPVIILVCEMVLFSADSRSVLQKRWMALFVVFPVFIIISYLIYKGFSGSSLIREFSIYDRILTEPRVIMNYLSRIFFPRPSGLGLFYDDFVISRGLFVPAQTLPSLLCVVGFIFAAIFWRRRFPGYCFGVLWYIGGHLLESTTIMLEIGFEHRNYFPMIGMVIGFGYELERLFRGRVRPFLLILLAAIGIGTLGAIAATEARMWGNQMAMSAAWAKEKPQSERAQDLYAGVLAYNGFIDESFQQFKLSAHRFPRATAATSAMVSLACLERIGPKVDMSVVADRFSFGKFSFAPLTNLAKVVEEKESGRCLSVSNERLVILIDSLLSNPAYQYPEYKAHLYILKGRLHALGGQLNLAVGFLDDANAVYPRLDVAVHKVSWLMSANAWADARDALRSARDIAESNPADYLAFRHVMAQMEKTINSHI